MYVRTEIYTLGMRLRVPEIQNDLLEKAKHKKRKENWMREL